MSRLSIDERFAQFEEDAVPTFKPEVDQVYSGLRRLRRKRRIKYAVAAAVLVAIPATWFGIDQLIGDNKPALTATANGPRKVNIAGAPSIGEPSLTFIDAKTGFALYNRCHVAETPNCRYFGGVTTDGGITWRSMKLPDLEDNRRLEITADNAEKFYLSAINQASTQNAAAKPEIWETRDGGATFTPSQGKAPETSMSTYNNSLYLHEVECHGKYDFTSGKQAFLPDTTCTPTLVKRGSGPVATQPPGLDYTSVAYTGADGRIWLTTGRQEAGSTAFPLTMSADDGKTWQKMPDRPGGSSLTFSPDGKEIYGLKHTSMTDNSADGKTQVHQLSGDTWVELVQGPVGAWISAIPLGDGVLVVQSEVMTSVTDNSSDLFFLKDGVRYPVPVTGIRADRVLTPLRDGTIVIPVQKGIYLGVGTGVSREWILISY